MKASEVREAAREAQRMKREKEQREQRRERQEPYLQRPFTDSKREERYKEKEQRQEEQERLERDERLRREEAEEARKAEVARLQREERQRLQQEEDERIRRQGEDAERERVRKEQQARIDRGDDWREVEEGKEQEPPEPAPEDDDDDDDEQNRQSHFVVVKEEDVDKERKKQAEKRRESGKTPEERKAEAEEAAKREETALKQRSARKKVIDRYKARVKAKEVARQKKDEEQTAETRQRRKDAAVAGGYLDQPRGDGQPSTLKEDTPRKRKRGVLDEVALAEGLAQLKKRKAVKASIKEKGQVDDAFLDPSYQPQMEEEEDDDLGEVPLRTVKEGAGEGETTHEHCSNPDEAEDHRIRIYASVYGLQEMVKSGDAVGEAYKDFLKVIVDSLLNIEKADIDAVYGLVPDQEYEIWRQVMVGGEEISQMRAKSIKEQIMKPVVERENKVKVTIDWSILEDGMNDDETRNLRTVCGDMFKDL